MDSGVGKWVIQRSLYTWNGKVGNTEISIHGFGMGKWVTRRSPYMDSEWESG